jgi:hypothetical protein
MTDLLERIRQIVKCHHKVEGEGGAGAACSCGAEALADHPRHVAKEIIDRLGLRPDAVSNVSEEVRYITGWFNDELTKLEGAE